MSWYRLSAIASVRALIEISMCTCCASPGTSAFQIGSHREKWFGPMSPRMSRRAFMPIENSDEKLCSVASGTSRWRRPSYVNATLTATDGIAAVSDQGTDVVTSGVMSVTNCRPTSAESM